MTKFKHKNGGITEVFTQLNIERLRKDKNYKEIDENTSIIEEVQELEEVVEIEEEVVEVEPLQ